MDYKKMYLSLFNSITDSLNALESLNFGQAADILRQAQSDCEELYVEDAEELIEQTHGRALNETQRQRDNRPREDA